MNRLTDRQHIILNSVVDAHIESAVPIGSELLTRRFHLGFSSATIRNEMGSLEEMGYLTHPHTSSGRLPTDDGYRYYVDYCVDYNKVPKEQKSRWERAMESIVSSAWNESSAETLSKLAAELSEEAGIFIFEPEEAEHRDRGARLLVQGTSHLLDKPEFQDARKLKKLFQALEEKYEIAHWISNSAKQETDSCVKIGKENALAVLWDCAVISAVCGKNLTNSTIAIMGPRRMRYDVILPLVRLIAGMAGEILSGRSDN